ncbi:RXT2-like protein [Coniochaeta sp. 2T2.1]|nr:RXT2-like protein [Coniochaeta sp. 2T2.1]
MATQQQALLMETVMALRKAVKRKAYDSDSDDSVEQNTNRGHKLQRRARFVKKGNLAPAMAPAAYKEVVDHAGYQRVIINRNPPLIDDEGYEIDSDDDQDRVQEAMADAADANPYSSIHLEQIFAPLTSVTDLPNHPTLSRPFTSTALSRLAVQGRDLLHKENKALWKVKPLLTRLQGDHTWAPCSMMIQPNEVELFADELFIQYTGRPSHAPSVIRAATPITNGHAKALPPATQGNLPTTEGGQPKEQNAGASTSRIQPGNSDRQAAEPSNTENPTESHADQVRPTSLPPEIAPKASEAQTNGTTHQNGEAPQINHTSSQTVDNDVEMADSPSPSRPNAVVAVAPPASYQPTNPSRAASVTTSAAADDLYIHPIFLAPRSAHPDRDQGLPDQEAEDVRRLLQLYVQKQEEVCRGTKKLYEGLLKADRYRKTVLAWSKAEAHRGELSDGEDWYDREEWGLAEDLKKGHDEEEEETLQTQKKTRNRK